MNLNKSCIDCHTIRSVILVKGGFLDVAWVGGCDVQKPECCFIISSAHSKSGVILQNCFFLKIFIFVLKNLVTIFAILEVQYNEKCE